MFVRIRTRIGGPNTEFYQVYFLCRWTESKQSAVCVDNEREQEVFRIIHGREGRQSTTPPCFSSISGQMRIPLNFHREPVLIQVGQAHKREFGLRLGAPTAATRDLLANCAYS